MASRSVSSISHPPYFGVKVRVSRTDYERLMSRDNYGHWLVERMQAYVKPYNTVVAVIVKSCVIHFLTETMRESHVLADAMHESIPSNLQLTKSTTKVEGLSQPRYMLSIDEYDRPEEGNSEETKATARKELEEHFGVKPGQIYKYHAFGTGRIRIETSDLNLIFRFYDATDGFKRCLILGGNARLVKAVTEECLKRQCYNCQGFGHESRGCKRPKACSRCDGEHDIKQCYVSYYDEESKRCANCSNWNKKAGPTDQLDIHHDATNLAYCKHPDTAKELARIEAEQERIDRGELYWLEVMESMRLENMKKGKRKAPSDGTTAGGPRKTRLVTDASSHRTIRTKLGVS